MKLVTRALAPPISLARPPQVAVEPATLSGVRRILVLVRGGMADAVRATPYLAALRQVYREAELHVACEWWSVQLLRGCPSIDRVLPLPAAEWSGALRSAGRCIELARLLTRTWRRYDLVLVSPYGRRLNDVLARFASRRYRFGFGGNGGDGWTLNLGYPDYALPLEQHYGRLFAAVGVRDVELRAELGCSADDEQVVDHFLATHAWAPPLIALHPGSDWSCQQWAPDRWTRLAEALHERYGGTAVVTGSAADRPVAERAAGDASCPTLVAAGRFSPMQTAALIGRCRFVVSVDSVAPALALAVGTPVAVIEAWPGPDWQAWQASGRLGVVRPAVAADRLNERCRAAIGRIRSSCHTPHCAGTGGLRLIEADDVLASVERLLSQAEEREVGAGG